MCLNFIIGCVIFLIIYNKIYQETYDINLSLIIAFVTVTIYWVVTTILWKKIDN